MSMDAKAGATPTSARPTTEAELIADLEHWVQTAAPGDQWPLPRNWHSKAHSVREVLNEKAKARNPVMRVWLTQFPVLSFALKVYFYDDKPKSKRRRHQWASKNTTPKRPQKNRR